MHEPMRTTDASRRRILAGGIMALGGAALARVAAASPETNEVSRAGGTFTLFGGYIVGRQIELVPPELIVQAWRAGSWSPGVYSIARFQLGDEKGGTRLVFDHSGFPKGQAEHLASGWHEHYWDPQAKFLAHGS